MEDLTSSAQGHLCGLPAMKFSWRCLEVGHCCPDAPSILLDMEIHAGFFSPKPTMLVAVKERRGRSPKSRATSTGKKLPLRKTSLELGNQHTSQIESCLIERFFFGDLVWRSSGLSTAMSAIWDEITAPNLARSSGLTNGCFTHKYR